VIIKKEKLRKLIMSAMYWKQTCYLCEMPRSPWAVLHDFSEIVCRSCVNYEGADRIEATLGHARRMRGSYGEPGVKRESSAPYPTPRMPPNPNHVSAASLHTMNGAGPGQGGLPSPMGSGPGNYPGVGAVSQPSMQTVTLDQVPFQRRPSPAAPGYQGPGGGQMMAGPGLPHHKPGQGMMQPEPKLSGARPNLPPNSARPSSTNSAPGQNGPPTPGSRGDQVSSSSNGSNDGPGGGPQLKCTNCNGKLEDTHFVQCPSNITHKFCFTCCRDSIIKQGSEAFCPSGERCPLQGSTVPWAFMQEEIETILGEHPDKGKEKK